MNKRRWTVQMSVSMLRKRPEFARGLIAPLRWAFVGGAVALVSADAAAEGKHLVVVVPPIFEDAGDFADGLAPAKDRGLWGYVNGDGSWKVKPAFDAAGPFYEGLARVKKGEHYGFVNKQGVMVIAPTLDDAHDFSSGLAAAKKENTWGYIDAKGIFAVAPKYGEAGEFHDGRAPVKLGEAWGFIDAKGNEAIAPHFGWAGPFSEGLAVVRDPSSGLYGYVNPKGDFAIAATFGTARAFAGGHAVVAKEADPNDGDDSLRGLAKSILLDSVLFDGSCPNNATAARSASGRRFGAIDREGHEVVPMKYDNLRAFDGGFVVREFGTGDGLLAADGGTVVAPKWSNTAGPEHAFMAILDQDKLGYVGLDGQAVVAPTYDWPATKPLGGVAGEDADYLPGNVGGVQDGFAWFSKGGKYGWLKVADKALSPAEEAKLEARRLAAEKVAEAARKAAEQKAARERAEEERKAAAERAASEKRAAAERAARKARYGSLPKYLRKEYECTRDDLYAAAQNDLNCQELHCVGECLVERGLPRSAPEALERGMDFDAYRLQGNLCEQSCKSSSAKEWRQDNIEGYPRKYCIDPWSGTNTCNLRGY